MIGIPPICPGCTHFRPMTGLTCEAFPSGIPTDILENKFDHRRSHPLDGGIIFEPKNDAEAKLANDTFEMLRPKLVS